VAGIGFAPDDITYCNKQRAMEAIRALMPHRERRHVPAGQRLKGVGFALPLTAALFAVDQLLVNLFGHGKG
jgi:hypothetical protein